MVLRARYLLSLVCSHQILHFLQVFSSWHPTVRGGNVGGAGVDASGVGGGSQKASRGALDVFASGRGVLADIHNCLTLPAIAEIERR